ncbi:hypothetical protein GGR50DRAFT_571149 [Xylaria sp. CBS 124048]|nr:hypothetical protein GGR50DRAFT_571149 [Xylaria sp. CBS 124048]
MISLSSLLNPAPPEPSNGHGFPPSPESLPTPDSCGEGSSPTDRSTMTKHKMPKDAAVFTKSKPKGDINFKPYENLDEASLELVRRFQVYPFGEIQHYSRHIPYNSGKKDFFEKTGRESFEVFQYIFKVPGDDTEYVVMWDYNIGLVRMTSFFKCCKYPKTTPAKMLNSNPGLKEITHSITGGSITAQGYWMPYQCAVAICATFCHKIAGALIPIFGPNFPALCTPAEAPEYSRMVIDPTTIIQSTREAEYYRRHYSNNTASSSLSPPSTRNEHSLTPRFKRDRRVFRSPYDDSSGSLQPYRVRKAYTNNTTTPGSENGSYTTDTEGQISPPMGHGGLVRDPPFHRFPRSSMPPPISPLRPNNSISSNSSGWTPVNGQPSSIPTHLRSYTEYPTSGPSPWLSALPRLPSHLTPRHLRPPHYATLNAPSQRPDPSPYHHTPTNATALTPLQTRPGDVPPQLSPLTFYPPSQTPTQTQTATPTPKRPAAHSENDVPNSFYREATSTRLISPPLPPPPPQPQQQQQQKQPVARRISRTRTAETLEIRARDEREDRESNNNNNPNTNLNIDTKPTKTNDDNKHSNSNSVGADNKAALLLMNLSVRDQLFWTDVGSRQTPYLWTPGMWRKRRNRGTGGDGGHADFHTHSTRTINTGVGGDDTIASSSSRTRTTTTQMMSAPLDEDVSPRIKRFRSNSM